jgi:(p)ppGpp synthase/HD superfamily hydrolase
MMATTFEKLYLSLRYYLISAAKFDKSYVPALNMLEFAKDVHVGTRKDGCTPEFQHQLEIAHFMRTLSDLRNPALVIGLALGHDILEDYSDKAPFVTFEQVCGIVGCEMADEIMTISKEYKGKKLSTEEYYANLAKTPHGSVAKGGDRIHNQGSMAHVFTTTKQMSYVDETENFVLPMLKIARRKFFDQEAAYENIKFVLKSQNTFVRAYIPKLMENQTIIT